MYLPTHFEERRPAALHALLRGHPLGLLITTSQPAGGDAPPRIESNPIPFLFDAERGAHGTLVAHVARANPVWREARTDAESLVVFQGPQAYVSPSWYATKAATGKVVPTWNYMVAEARGRIRFIVDDAGWLHALVSRLTDRHEADRASPWAVTDAPADFVAGQLRAIVGVEIELTSLVGKWKLSQNRPAADRDGVVRALSAQAATRGDAQAQAVATEVAAAAVAATARGNAG